MLFLILQLFCQCSAFAQDSPKPAPYSPSFPHTLLSNNGSFSEPSSYESHPTCKLTQTTKISKAQFSLESQVSRSVFELSFITDPQTGESEIATAFLVSDDLMITNRHVLERLTDLSSGQVSKPKLDSLVKGISLRNSGLDEILHPEKVEYCSKTLDVCVLRLKRMSNGKKVGSVLPLMKLAQNLNGLTKASWVGIVGNMEGDGIQASSDHIVNVDQYGLIKHCIPTSSLSSGGNSGSPIFDQTGVVIGIDAYSLALDSHCALRDRTTGAGVSMPLFLRELSSSSKSLYEELNLNP